MKFRVKLICFLIAFSVTSFGTFQIRSRRRRRAARWKGESPKRARIWASQARP